MTDQWVIDVTRILCGLRSALGLAPDGRACLIQAFGADDAKLQRLHEALGRVISRLPPTSREPADVEPGGIAGSGNGRNG